MIGQWRFNLFINVFAGHMHEPPPLKVVSSKSARNAAKDASWRRDLDLILLNAIACHRSYVRAVHRQTKAGRINRPCSGTVIYLRHRTMIAGPRQTLRMSGMGSEADD